MSTLAALSEVLHRHGRFCELYTDRGSHFTPAVEGARLGRGGPGATGAPDAGHPADSRALSRGTGAQRAGLRDHPGPTAAGATPQWRQHLRRGVRLPSGALRPGLQPTLHRHPARARQRLREAGDRDLDLVLSVQHERIVRTDNVVVFGKLLLQLPPSRTRGHFARCPVLVHGFTDGTLGVSYQGRLVGRFDVNGELLPLRSSATAAA